ncbi:MAG TPA: NRDE family protein [Modicisalibacter sp.]|nr:NRDE family protein [Modicisalibacter sp.]
MCLIVFDWRPGSAMPLRLAANRDEFHDRPAAALAAWDDAPDIIGGRDLRAGGTWLAVHAQGRLAAVTNVRDPQFKAPIDGPSRGELVRNALECKSLPAWLNALVEGGAGKYAGFNLLVSDGRKLWHLHHGRDATRLQAVAAGLHGLSNASLDTPWPKLERSRARLGEALADTGQDFAKAAWELLADDHRPDDAVLPDTGVGLPLERLLSSPFIVGDDYGTRASTWVAWHASGEIAIGERSFGPEGSKLGETQLGVTKA